MPVMKSPRIRIWKHSDAPKSYQLLHNGLGTPSWVALVPQEIASKDLDEVMTANGRQETVSHYEMPNGDVVYVGTLNQVNCPKFWPVAPTPSMLARSPGDVKSGR